MTEQQVVLITDLVKQDGKPFDPIYLQAIGDDAEKEEEDSDAGDGQEADAG